MTESEVAMIVFTIRQLLIAKGIFFSNEVIRLNFDRAVADQNAYDPITYESSLVVIEKTANLCGLTTY